MTEAAIKAVLYDLDGTLLINDMDAFVRPYLGRLAARVQHECSPELFLWALNVATRAMFDNDGRDVTNAEVFRAEFFPRVDREPEELIPLFDEFYARDFEALREYTKVDPDARVLVELTFRQGFQVAVATQPVFPLVAILARLRWAGVGADEFDYDQIASYETMTACKPHPRYFATLLERLGRSPEECLMVGDSPQADMRAGRLGLKTFWVNRDRAPRPEGLLCDAEGDLSDLIALMETGSIHEL